MELLEYPRIFRRRWRIIAASVVVALLAVGLASGLLVPGGPSAAQVAGVGYTAKHTLVVEASESSTSGRVAVSVLANSPEIPQRVAEDLGLEDPQLVSSRVTITSDEETGLLTVEATDPEPEVAKELADATAGEIIAYSQERSDARVRALVEATIRSTSAQEARIREVEQKLATLPPGSVEARIAVAERVAAENVLTQLQERLATAGAASVTLYSLEAGDPVLPEGEDDGTVLSPPQGPVTQLLLGGFLGLALGMVLAIVVDRVDPRIHARSEAERAFGVPVVAEIPSPRRSLRARLRRGQAVPENPVIDEAYGRLRLAILHMPRWVLSRRAPTRATELEDGAHLDSRMIESRSVGVVVVASATAGEGRTTTVANLSARFAESGQAVVAVDCDSKTPSLRSHLGIEPPQKMLGDDDSREDWVLVNSGLPHVDAMPAPLELTARERATSANRAIRIARERADVVIVDTGPLLSTNDAAGLVPDADAVVLVARTSHVTESDAHETRDLLASLEAPLSGVVLIGGQATGPGVLERLLAGLRGLTSGRDRERTRAYSGARADQDEGDVFAALLAAVQADDERPAGTPDATPEAEGNGRSAASSEKRDR